MYHALGAAWPWRGLLSRWPGPLAAVRAGWLFVAGTVLFSGSLYALALSGVRWLGAITPLGGVAFLAGWICLALRALTPRVSSWMTPAGRRIADDRRPPTDRCSSELD